MANTESVAYLNYLIRTYHSVADTIAETKNRLGALPGEHPAKFDSILKAEGKSPGLETIKGRLGRLIEKELSAWDIWEHWLKQVPGIGPVFAADLIMLYYYKHLPACPDCLTEIEKQEKTFYCPTCEKSVKGKGNLAYVLKGRDFPTISKWWAFMGRDIQNGAMRKRKKGETANWSARGRTLGFLIADQFNRKAPDHLYKAVMLAEMKKYEKTQPDISKGWRFNKAKNNTVKLFLAHFWTVARQMANKPVSEPYAMVIMGHTNYIAPFYYQE